MEEYFLINNFEDGYRHSEFIYEEVVLEYCTEALFIPEEKILNAIYIAEGIEIVLYDLEIDDIKDDWYVNLQRLNAS